MKSLWTLTDRQVLSSLQIIISRMFGFFGLVHCCKSFEEMMLRYHKEPLNGIGCFTVNIFPVFDHFNQNVSFISESNHAREMIGICKFLVDSLLATKGIF